MYTREVLECCCVLGTLVHARVHITASCNCVLNNYMSVYIYKSNTTTQIINNDV